jgi:low temperature requirement protein LtrA
VLGGPALFLAGHLFFKRVVFNVWSTPRITAIVVLAALGFIAQDWPPLALSTAALLVVAGVSLWDVRTAHYQQSLALEEEGAYS